MSHWYTGTKFAGNETVSRFNDVDAFIESALETKRTLTQEQQKNARSVELPQDMGLTGVKPVLAKLGAPADAKGYGLPDNPVSNRIAAAFVEAGVLPSQVAPLTRAIQELETVNAASEKARMEKLDGEFKASLGDKYGAFEESLTRFSAKKDDLNVQVYEQVAKSDPKLAKTFAMNVIQTPSKEGIGAPMKGAGTATERLKGVMDDYAKARQEGKHHFLMRPTEQESKDFNDLAAAAEKEKQGQASV